MVKGMARGLTEGEEKERLLNVCAGGRETGV